MHSGVYELFLDFVLEVERIREYFIMSLLSHYVCIFIKLFFRIQNMQLEV